MAPECVFSGVYKWEEVLSFPLHRFLSPQQHMIAEKVGNFQKNLWFIRSMFSEDKVPLKYRQFCNRFSRFLQSQVEHVVEKDCRIIGAAYFLLRLLLHMYFSSD